jgi:hypothetical protein
VIVGVSCGDRPAGAKAEIDRGQSMEDHLG